MMKLFQHSTEGQPTVVFADDEVHVYGWIRVVDLDELGPEARRELLEELSTEITAVIRFPLGGELEGIDRVLDAALTQFGYRAEILATYPGNLVEDPNA